MAKTKWDEETIIKRILALQDIGEDLTCSRAKEIDSKLVGAAISFFGNWGNAVEAAGLDYGEIRTISRKNRSEKVRKWTKELVLDAIRKAAESEEDISYAYMKEKHSSLVAAACNYVGSWKKALELIGFDYDEVQRKGHAARVEREKAWYKDLLLERLDKTGIRSATELKAKHPDFHKLLIKHFKSWAKTLDNLDKRKKGRKN